MVLAVVLAMGSSSDVSSDTKKLSSLFELREEGRFLELDLLRGLAIVLMIVAHILWDLDYFKLVSLNEGVYKYFQFSIPPVFFFLVGLCLAVSSHRIVGRGWSYLVKRGFLRGGKVFVLGLVLSAFSFVLFPDKPIIFGVLHCIGLSVVIATPLLKLRWAAAPLGLGLVGLGVLVWSVPVVDPSLPLFVLGFHPTDVWYLTLDYFPLLPWFGVVLFGLGMGDVLYRENKRRFSIPEFAHRKSARSVSWVGQHSLAFYLAHQPVIYAILWAFVGVKGLLF